MTVRSRFSSCAARDAVTVCVDMDALILLWRADRTDEMNDYESVGRVPFRNYYWVNSAGRPVRRSIRFAIGGCVENKLPRFIPSSG